MGFNWRKLFRRSPVLVVPLAWYHWYYFDNTRVRHWNSLICIHNEHYFLRLISFHLLETIIQQTIIQTTSTSPYLTLIIKQLHLMLSIHSTLHQLMIQNQINNFLDSRVLKWWLNIETRSAIIGIHKSFPYSYV